MTAEGGARAPGGAAPVGRQLHDVVVPQLFVITTGLTALQRSGVLDANAELVGDLLDTASSALQDLRRISRGERLSVALELDAVGERLRDQTRLLGPLTDCTVEIGVEGTCTVPAELVDDLVAVVWETAVNAVRHGGASSFAVHLRAGTDVNGAGELELAAADDGGWTTPTDAESSGLGGLGARAERWGGRLSVDGSDAGTTVVWRVPAPFVDRGHAPR